MSSTLQIRQPFIRRLLQYLKERFPLVQHGIIIAIFSFSAIAYSRISSGKSGFIPGSTFVIGFLMAFTLFLLLRLLDEIKDFEDDSKYRQYLPLPRGLIRLYEIQGMIGAVLIVQVGLILVFQPRMLLFYLLVMGYMFLMTKEFFAPAWLRRHPIIYVVSHMMIIPFVDMYSSGLDWLLGGTGMHWGLAWFFAVSFFNGIVLEFGRKMRTPETEEPGVVSYTGLYGTKGGPLIWMGLLFTTLLLAMGAAHYAGFSRYVWVFLTVLCLVLMLPAMLFIIRPTKARSKWIEHASGIWTAMMYLTLGAAPMVEQIW